MCKSTNANTDNVQERINAIFRVFFIVADLVCIHFVTSDYPVSRYYPSTDAAMGAGVTNEDLEVYFPFAYDRVICLKHDHAKLKRLGDAKLPHTFSLLRSDCNVHLTGTRVAAPIYMDYRGQ